MTWTTFRDCGGGRNRERLAEALKRAFAQTNSRFRAYNHPTDKYDIEDLVVDHLLEPGAVWHDQPSWSRVEPGKPVLGAKDKQIGVYGETRDNVHWGFSAAYLPDSRRWAFRRIGGRLPSNSVYGRIDPISGELGEEKPEIWTSLNLNVQIMFWELADYLEVELAGPMWERGWYAIETGLAEDWMQDLLTKTFDLRSEVRPALVDIGAGYDVRDANKTFRQERRIPRLSWANIFGPPYVEKYGKRFLLDAPGFRKEELPDGSILYQVTERFFLTDEDVERGPPPEEVEAYFRKHPAVQKIVYRPILLRDFVPRSSRAGEIGRPRRTTTDLIRMAEDAVSVFGDRFGIILDYTPESLRKMDDAISTHFEEGEEPLPTTVLPLGAYVGEVVRVNLGGDWRLAEPLTESSVVITGSGGGHELYPFRRVEKRFVEGRGASLLAWYEAAGRAVDGH